MDKQQEQLLARMSKRVPKDIRNSLVEKADKYSDEFKEGVRKMADNTHIPESIRRTARAMITSGEVNAKVDVVNKKAERDWDKRLSSEMKKAMARGELKPLSREDQLFMKERADKIKREQERYGKNSGFNGGRAR